MTAGDMLLHVVSAKRELSWTSFRLAFDTLTMREGLDVLKPSLVRSIVLRRFDSLAHVETVQDGNNRRVVVGASALVRLPTEQPSAILAGSRSIDTLDHLRTMAADLNASVTADDQRCDDAALLPSRISIHTADETVLGQCAATLGVAYDPTPVAWTLGHVSASIEEICARLRFESEPELNWARSDFDVSRCHFRKRIGARPSSCLTRYVDPVKGSFRFCLWKGNVCAWVDADWGRFLALREAQADVVWFDSSENVLAVPETVPLPRLIARSLTLCSGYVAHAGSAAYYGGQTRASLFINVPKTLAALVATKLGQTLVYRKLGV